MFEVYCALMGDPGERNKDKGRVCSALACLYARAIRPLS